ncbi:hypothetical protein TNCV_423531 [Trichonephila clavipes]|nr:hypothetical protein TNCV_423531 [Trichonephila clavipes]
MGCFLGISRVLGELWTAGRYPSADFRPIRKADCVSKNNPLQNTEFCQRVRGATMTQGPSESVQEFAARINKLGTQIFQSGNSAQNTAVRNANDQLLQSRFISGLKNEIRRFVLSRDPLNLEESINAALIEEQNMKLNQIASEERSGLSSAQTENPVLSALADRLQEINLRVGRLQEASAVTARKSGGNYSNRRENVFKCFYCGIQGHRQAECRKRQRDERAARYQPPRRNAASGYSFSSSPRPGGRHVHFRESTLRDNYAAPRHSQQHRNVKTGTRGRNENPSEDWCHVEHHGASAAGGKAKTPHHRRQECDMPRIPPADIMPPGGAESLRLGVANKLKFQSTNSVLSYSGCRAGGILSKRGDKLGVMGAAFP